MVRDGAGVTALWTANYAMILPLAFIAAAFQWVRPPSSYWWDSMLGGVLDALGNLAMVAALRVSDLSVFGPLNAIRPIIALVFGWIFLKESPTYAGLFGIVITALGGIIVLKGDRANGSVEGIWKILAFRCSGLALGTIASVFLKRAALSVSAEMTVAGWIFFGLLTLVIFGIATGEPLGPARAGKWIYLHVAVFFTMQLITIRIFKSTLLSYAFVFFQLGMILQVIAGKVFFDEPHFVRRFLGCIIMSAGAALIIWRG